MNNDNGGYSPFFYIALILGIVGILGFFIIAAGAGAGL